jgi:hypothetical protein
MIGPCLKDLGVPGYRRPAWGLRVNFGAGQQRAVQHEALSIQSCSVLVSRGDADRWAPRELAEGGHLRPAHEAASGTAQECRR